MLPAAFVTLNELPLTASGKVNRLALPAPTNLKRKPARTAVLQTPLEKLLLPIWIDILGVNIGTHDNFFEHGGHSKGGPWSCQREQLHLRAICERSTSGFPGKIQRSSCALISGADRRPVAPASTAALGSDIGPS